MFGAIHLKNYARHTVCHLLHYGIRLIYWYSLRLLHWHWNNRIWYDNIIQMPVPLTRFRSNWKFDQNLECSTDHKETLHTSCLTVVTCVKFRCDRPNMLWTRALPSFIEFHRDNVSGTGAGMGASIWLPQWQWINWRMQFNCWCATNERVTITK